jgi:hypothetical protein
MHTDTHTHTDTHPRTLTDTHDGNLLSLWGASRSGRFLVCCGSLHKISLPMPHIHVWFSALPLPTGRPPPGKLLLEMIEDMLRVAVAPLVPPPGSMRRPPTPTATPASSVPGTFVDPGPPPGTGAAGGPGVGAGAAGAGPGRGAGVRLFVCVWWLCVWCLVACAGNSWCVGTTAVPSRSVWSCISRAPVGVCPWPPADPLSLPHHPSPSPYLPERPIGWELLYTERERDLARGTKHHTRIAQDGPGELAPTKIITPTGSRGGFACAHVCVCVCVRMCVCVCSRYVVRTSWCSGPRCRLVNASAAGCMWICVRVCGAERVIRRRTQAWLYPLGPPEPGEGGGPPGAEDARKVCQNIMQCCACAVVCLCCGVPVLWCAFAVVCPVQWCVLCSGVPVLWCACAVVCLCCGLSCAVVCLCCGVPVP